MKINLTSVLSAFLMGAFLLIPGSAAVARVAAINSDNNPEVVYVTSTQVKGRITRIENRTLTLDTSSGSKTVEVAQNVRLKRNSANAQFSDLKINDEATITIDGAGRVLDISATSGNLADASQLVLPGMILLALILLIAYYLMRRSRADHIKTTTTQFNS